MTAAVSHRESLAETPVTQGQQLQCGNTKALNAHSLSIDETIWSLRFVSTPKALPKRLCFSTCQQNSDGDCVGRLHLPDGRWAQKQWLETGQSVVISGTPWAESEPEDFAALWVAEARPPIPRKVDELSGKPFSVLKQLVGQEILIEGTVVGVSKTNQGTYINFSDDWRNDTTALVQKGVRIKPVKKGQSLRIRGLLDLYNGPLIHIQHDRQVEILP